MTYNWLYLQVSYAIMQIEHEISYFCTAFYSMQMMLSTMYFIPSAWMVLQTEITSFCAADKSHLWKGIKLAVVRKWLLQQIYSRIPLWETKYRNYPSIETLANSVDSDQTPQNAASDQGLYCLPLIQQFLNISVDSKMHFFNF